MRNTVLIALLQRVISRMNGAMESALLKLTKIIGVHSTPMIPFAHQQPQPAKVPRKRKSFPAHTDSKDKSRKVKLAPAQILTAWPFPDLGSQPVTAAKSSGKRKAKHSSVLPTTVAPLHKLGKQPPADKPQHGKQSVTPAFPIRQRAKRKVKAKL